MSPSVVYVIGRGARTPVGVCAAASAAAVAAGISGVSEHPDVVDEGGVPLSVAADRFLDLDVVGDKRLLELADSALREACDEALEIAPLGRLTVHVALPEPRPGFGARDAEHIRQALRASRDLPCELARVEVFPEGRAGGFRALVNAVREMAATGVDACLVGGVDSYLDPLSLMHFDRQGRLQDSKSRSAFVPGEASGFVVLASSRLVAKAGRLPGARVVSCGLASEPSRSGEPGICTGKGLGEALGKALDGLPAGQRVWRVICDINGERYKAEEWGFASLRHGSRFRDTTDYSAPAQSWGDVGAASAPLALVLASRDEPGLDESARYSLAWAGSDSGLRGAALVEHQFE